MALPNRRGVRRSSNSNHGAFDCRHCSKSFPTKRECQAHMNLHFRERRFQCSTCEKTFLKQAHLREHARIHSGERPFECNLCPLDFITSGALFAHKLSYHPESLFYCGKCGRKFQKQSSLDLHKCGPRKKIVRAHPLKVSAGREKLPSASQRKRGNSKESFVAMSPKPYRCNICDRRFFTPKNVVRHKRFVHFRHKSLSLPVLPKKGNSRGNLSSAKIAASKIKSGSKYKSVSSGHKCHICGMGFRVPSVLQRHMKTHTGEDTYSCHICGKHIRRFDGLQSHMRQHTGNAIHTCLHCDMSFDAIIRLKRHMRSVHGQVPDSLVSCEVCNKFFVNELDLQRHMELGIHAIKHQALEGRKEEEEVEEEENIEDENEDSNDSATSAVIEINTDPGFLEAEEKKNDKYHDAAKAARANENTPLQFVGPDLNPIGVVIENGFPSMKTEEMEDGELQSAASIAHVKQEPDIEAHYMSDIDAMKADLVMNEEPTLMDAHEENLLGSAAAEKSSVLESSEHVISDFHVEEEEEGEEVIEEEEEEEEDDEGGDIGPAEPATHGAGEAGEHAQSDDPLDDCYWVDHTFTGTKKGTRYNCKYCDKQFRDVTQVRDHSWVHTGVKRHRCSHCGKDFTASCSLRVHLKNVHSQLDIPDGRYVIKQGDATPKRPSGTPSPRAATSPYTGNSPVTRRRSREALEDEKRVVAAEVATTSQKVAPQVPRASLSKGQRIQCHSCPKTFIDMTHLKNHMWVHTGIKLHKCVVCGKEFSTSGSLNVHKKSAHTEDQIIMAESNVEWESVSSFDDPTDSISRPAADLNHSPENPNQNAECCEELSENDIGEDDDEDDDDDDCFQVLAEEEEIIEVSGDEGEGFVLQREAAEHPTFPGPSTEKDSVDVFDTPCKPNSGYLSEENIESGEEVDPPESHFSRPGNEVSPNLDEETWQTVHIPGRKSRVGCPSCDKTFCDKANLRNHMWVHTGIKLHKCHICSKAFTTSSSLHVHMRRSHRSLQVRDPCSGEIRYVAKTTAADSSGINQQGWDSPSTSSSHDDFRPQAVMLADTDPMMPGGSSQSAVSNHTLENVRDGSKNSSDADDEMYNMDHRASSEAGSSSRQQGGSFGRRNPGGGDYRRNQNLAGRHASHQPRSRKHRIGCFRCEKTFSTMSHLSSHMWVHTGVKLHQCKICEKEFTTANSVKVHMRSMHSPSEIERVQNMSTQNPLAKHPENRSTSFCAGQEVEEEEEEAYSDEGNSAECAEMALSDDDCEVEGVISLVEEEVEASDSAGSDGELENGNSSPGGMRFMQIVNPSLSDEEDSKRGPVGSGKSLGHEVTVKQEVSDSPNQNEANFSEDEAGGHDAPMDENFNEVSNEIDDCSHQSCHDDKIAGESEEKQIPSSNSTTNMHQFESEYHNANSPFTSENLEEDVPPTSDTNMEDSGVASRTRGPFARRVAETDCSAPQKHRNQTPTGGKHSSRLQAMMKSGGGSSFSYHYTHGRAKKFKCTLCPKDFINKTDCQDHMWIHTGIKRHPCDICGARFVSSGGLKDHLERQHDEPVERPRAKSQMRTSTLRSQGGKDSVSKTSPTLTGLLRGPPKPKLLGPKSVKNRRLAAAAAAAAARQLSTAARESRQSSSVDSNGANQSSPVSALENFDDDPASGVAVSYVLGDVDALRGAGVPAAEMGNMPAFDCCVCSQTFSTLEELDNHMLGHPLD